MLFGGKKIKCHINYKNKQFVYELEKHRTIKELYDLISQESSITNISSLAIRLNSNKLPYYENDYEIPLISLDKDKLNELYFDLTKSFLCLECKKMISKYCLICDKYFCNNCQIKEHDNHEFVNIDPTNFKESIYLWNININASLSSDITQFNKLKDFIKDNVLSSKMKLWKDSIIKKLKKFEKFINDICILCNKIGNNYIEKKSELLNKLMQDLSKTEQNINSVLSTGQDSKYKSNIIFSFEEAEPFINKLKKHHNEIKSKNKDLKDLYEIENINILNDTMGKINYQIDDLTKNSLKIFDSFKRFFNKYDNNSYESYSNISLSPQKYVASSNDLFNSVNSNIIKY